MRYLLLEYMTNRHAGLPVIKMLLMNGFDMTTGDSHGERALDNTFRQAFRIRDLAMAKYLLEHGADIKCRSPVPHETDLHTATRLMHWPMVEMLLLSGVEINARNRENETALFIAAIRKELDDPEKKLFVCYNVDGTEDLNRPALLKDFNSSARLPVIKLLDAGIDANAKDHKNNTVLFRAVCRESTPIVEQLLDHGADIHALNSDDRSTALHAAAGCGDLLLVQTLLANGCDINSQRNNGSTALHIALQHRDIEMANFLLESGIDISACAKLLHHFDHNPHVADGASALYFVVRWGHEGLAKQLLAKGASVNVQYHLKYGEGFRADESLRNRMAAMFDNCWFRPVILCEGRDGDVQTRPHTFGRQ